MEVLAVGIPHLGERILSHSSNLISLSSLLRKFTRFPSIQFNFRNSKLRNYSSISLQEKLPSIEDEEKEDRKYEDELMADRNLALLDDYEMEESDFDPNHKSGYKPNVRKSTLINQTIGQKLSIVTDKPQTTRH